MQYCPRLTHLSLTGVQAFLREDLTRFCREAPPEFTHPQRDVFCVFSGEGVSRLRGYLKRLAEDQEHEGRAPRDESGLYSEAEADSSRETVSDDETIDAAEDGAERQPVLLPRPDGYRSYADVVSGIGLPSPDRDETDGDEDHGIGRPGSRPGRMSPPGGRSSISGSLIEHGRSSGFGGYAPGDVAREASRSVSEGQGSSSRPLLSDSDAYAFDDPSPAVTDTPNHRPLPPRPHWPPQVPTARFLDGGRQPSPANWPPFSERQPSRNADTARSMRSAGQGGSMDTLDEARATAIYDTDDEDDGDMTVRGQVSPRGRRPPLHGVMES